MRDFTGTRLLLLLIPPLLVLLPLAFLVIILERISLSSVSSQFERNPRNGNREITLSGPFTPGSTENTNIDVQVNFTAAPQLAILGVSVLACLISGIGGFGIWELRKVEGSPKYQRAWTWSVIVSYLIMIGACIGVFAYATAEESNGNAWNTYEDVTKTKADQSFSRETWACQIDKLFPSQDWAGRACSTSKAARFMLIAMAVASLLAIGSLWVLIKDRGGFKWLLGGKGRYGGFQDIHEMQPPLATPNPYGQPQQQWPQTPGPQTPGPQWGPPQQQWMPQQMPQQQWTPQPSPHWAPAPQSQYMPQQQAPLMQKSGVAVESRPIFR